MSDILPLRSYQQAAIDRIEGAWLDGIDRPAVVLPTGAGKTVVFAHLARRVHAGGGQPTLVIVHTTELVDQALDKLRAVAPHLHLGRVQATANDTGADVVVGTVQSVRRSRTLDALAQRGLWLTVVDECHHATAASYRTVLDALGGRAAGFTATLSRGDGAALGDVWQKVVYRRDIIDMISEGHLLPVRGKRVRVPNLDFRKIKRTAGEYQADELGDALSEALAPELTAKAYQEHASDRAGILFAPTVASAHEFAEAFSGVGIVTEVVHGALPRHDRSAILKRFRDGHTQVVSNCMVLTEGFDEPRASCIVIARPTTSGGLYTQMAGRGLRPHPGQHDALILDVVGVTGRHRLASLVDLVGDESLRREPVEESLADLLLTADGLVLEDEGVTGGSIPLTYETGAEIEVLDVDLFARSHSAWLRTAGGTPFLSAGRATVFIVPAGGGGRWNVAVHEPGAPMWFEHRRLALDTAMSWGEEMARDYGAGSLTKRKASWRRNSEEPTEKQMDMARRMSITIPMFSSRGDASDLISVAIASRLIDTVTRGWTR